jgi:hypothetical protein
MLGVNDMNEPKTVGGQQWSTFAMFAVLAVPWLGCFLQRQPFRRGSGGTQG